MAKTIKELAEEKYPCRFTANNSDKRDGFVEGANAVLEEIEKCLDNPSMIQGYSDALAKVQELKGE